MAVPQWAPTRDKVAAYVPGRTLVGAADGYGNALLTFDDTTHPTGGQVDLLVADGCAWVTVKSGPVDASLTDMAAATAAKWVAAMVEQNYPDNRDDLNTATLLWQQATAMRDELHAANQAITGQDPEDPGAHLVPVYRFPDPFLGGDLEFN